MSFGLGLDFLRQAYEFRRGSSSVLKCEFFRVFLRLRGYTSIDEMNIIFWNGSSNSFSVNLMLSSNCRTNISLLLGRSELNAQ